MTLLVTLSPVLAEPRVRLSRTAKARLVAEIAATYVRVRWWLARLSFADAVAAARRVESVKQAPEAAEETLAAARLGQMVVRVLGAVPFDAKCLVRTLVLTRMLARRGIDASVVIGVRKSPEFAAHAWLELDHVPLLPTGPEFHRLSEL